MVRILITILFLLSIKTIAQQLYPNLVLGYEQQTSVSFDDYAQKKIYREYSSFEQAKMDTPENLMKSILSATNQQWYNANIWNGENVAKIQSQEYFDKITDATYEDLYIVLEHKLSFELNGIPTCIIKFFFHSKNEKPLSGAYVFQKRGERWYRTSNASTSGLSIIVMRFKTQVLNDIVDGNSKNIEIQRLIQRIYVNNVLSFPKLEKEFYDWYTPKEKKQLLDIYIDKNTW
ncbi:hypothetical protein ACI76O_08730 [Capnocytophaga cynodegmi]|uniref:hypothetical protein n=1 Tax=Capnocytophaga cynodegmi TaxID=28189 RepID=UPI00385B15CC